MELKIFFNNELSADVLDKEFFEILFDDLLKIKKQNWDPSVCLSWYK